MKSYYKRKKQEYQDDYMDSMIPNPFAYFSKKPKTKKFTEPDLISDVRGKDNARRRSYKSMFPAIVGDEVEDLRTKSFRSAKMVSNGGIIEVPQKMEIKGKITKLY